MNDRLKKLNFSELIELDVPNVTNYSFHDYANNNFTHPTIKGYCTKCEELGVASCGDEKFHLKNISHGASTKDFLESITTSYDTKDWHDGGVMFVMESPSKDYGIYTSVNINKNGVDYCKNPTKEWYWIHSYNNGILGYPEHFTAMKYGELIASAIVTFKLKNAYMTNLVKCGMNGPNDTFKGIDGFDIQCINNCVNSFLKKEIEIVQPKVIFTFGSKVYSHVHNNFGNKIKVVGLPHPAGRRRGFKDEYYNVLYFCMMAKWLYKEGVIDKNFYLEMMKIFADNN